MIRLLLLCIIVGILSVTYVGTYAVMSACGSYKLMVSKRVWQPTGVDIHLNLETGPAVAVTLNPLGYFFAPLLMLDHNYWHQHKPLL